MQFTASIALLLLAAAGSASAAFVPASTDTCTVLQRASLINLDKLGCAKVSADVLSKTKPIAKSETCKALQDGGLINLDALGCAKVEANVLADGTTKSASCSAKKLCTVMQKGLLNVDLLGCTNVDLDVLGLAGVHLDGGHGKRKHAHLPTPANPASCRAETCQILQKGGLGNLDLLGCGNVGAHVGP
ncbi:hypothetical protein A4X06_0g3781 [Tilletia controversa]|uniref:Hydrophobin n=3 Tax=Tilletia TaxID=13289 RepID=A0A8X7MV08_9BASI|nr:hypothetical protein CF336_g3317 [Tilletia laevis]KAE8204634.1 hypothetical protein CF335_g2581 [Tilletia laevis]KAE8248344.1 hypothetical protein A4X06_0g3781 [Tilletia controversa]